MRVLFGVFGSFKNLPESQTEALNLQQMAKGGHLMEPIVLLPPTGFVTLEEAKVELADAGVKLKEENHPTDYYALSRFYHSITATDIFYLKKTDFRTAVQAYKISRAED